MQRPLTIVHVDAERGFSGGEEQVFLLLEGLRRRGHESLLVAPPGSRCEAVARERGFATAAVPMRGDLDLAAVVRLRRLLAGHRPDLVHLHTGRAAWLGGLAARAAGVPAIATRRMDRPVRRGWRTRLVHGKLLRHTVAISPAVRRRLAEGGVDGGRTSTIASSVDPTRLAAARPRDEVRVELGAGPDDVLVLALGALVRRKGHDVLLAALARAADPRLRLAIAGDGPERAALERRARELELDGRARFLGRRADKAELLAACDVLALASRREGLGVAALEAMAAGRPVVASAVGGLGEAVQDGRTGLLVPPDDADALARALGRLAAEPELRARLGAAGPARVREGFLADDMVAAYEELYRRVLSAPAPGAPAR